MTDVPTDIFTEDEFRAEVERVIANASPHMKDRLRALQWKCDKIREKYGDNHIGSMVAISKLMMESVGTLNNALNGVPEMKHFVDPNSTSNVIRFITRRSDELSKPIPSEESDDD